MVGALNDFHSYFHPFDWHEILKDFTDCVSSKHFEKMPYKVWREFIDHSRDSLSNVRVYWNYDYDKYPIILDIYLDYSDGSPTMPFRFDSDDNSFGSFLYENYLCGLERDQMGEKGYFTYDNNGECYYTDSCGREYNVGYASKGYSLSDSISDSLATKADAAEVSEITKTIEKLCESAALAEPMTNSVKINTENKKESNIMKFNFDFGPVNPATVRMSLYGLAVKNKAGTWVSYDAKTGDIMDVDILNFDGAKFLYKMPVAIKDIAIGDIVIHNGIPMFVIAIAINGGYITAVDPINGERKDIMLPKSPFGFNFATKVVNFLGNTFNTSATAENPFGNMWMLMAMSGENKDMDDILPFLMLNNATPGIDNNVLMFMALSNTKNGSKDNILPMLMMLNAQHPVPNVPSKGCTCGGHCGEGQGQG